MPPSRILVVEDEPVLALTLARSLKALGHEVVGTVGSGEQAVRKAEETQPDVVLMDISLEGEMDGIDAAAIIRSRTDTALVYLTALTASEVFERAKITKPDAYLSKPISSKDLGRTIELSLYKRHMDKMLKEAEDRYRQLFEKISSAVAVYSAVDDGKDFVFVDFNAAAEKIERIGRESIIGKSVVEMFPGIKDFGLFDVFQRVWKTGKPEHHPVSLYKDERTVGWRENFVYKLPSGEIVAVYSDETVRKQAEEALAAEKERLSVTLRSIGDGVISTDTEGRVLSLNKVAEELTGWTEEEAVGKPCRDVFHIIDELTRDRCDNPVEKVLKTGNAIGQTNRTVLVSKNGSERIIADSGAPISDKDGNIIGVVLVFRDVTEKRRAEEKLKRALTYSETILATIKQALMLLDEDLRVISANRSFYNIFQVTQEVTVGRLLRDLEHDERSIPGLSDILEKVRDENSELTDFEVKFFVKNAGERIFLLNARRVTLTEGEHLVLLAIEDITERREAENTLQRQGRFLNNVLEALTHPFCVINAADYTIMTANSAAVGAGMPTGATCYSVIHNRKEPCNGQAHACPLEQIKKTKQPVAVEHIHEEAGGTRRYIQIHAYPLFDDEGNVDRMIEYCLDITDQKKAEEDLFSSLVDQKRISYQFQALLECSQGILESQEFIEAARITCDSCRKVTGATAGYVALLSKNGSENEVFFIESGGLPCTVDPSLPMPIRGLRAEAYQKGKPVYDNDFSGSRWMEFIPEGHVELKNVLFAPIKTEGKAIGLIGLANKPGGFDANDAALAEAFGELASLGLTRSRALELLAASEERYRFLVEHAPVGIISVDKEGRIIDINEELLKILGSPSVEATKSINILTFPPLVEAGISDAFKRCIEEGQPSTVEAPYTSRWGKDVYLRCFVTPVRDQRGSIEGCLATVEDFTQKRFAEQLMIRAERLQAVSDLAAGVSHNFNNMLQVVIGGSHLALSHLESGTYSEAKRALHMVIDGARSGAETVNRLQDFAAVQREMENSAWEIVDVSDVVQQALEMSKPWWKSNPEKRGLAISVDRHLESGCRVKGKKNELFEVSINLIKNAAEALTQGGRIEVRTFVDDGNVILQVQDNGVGIPQKTMGRIFEPFFTTKGPGGTGMGLASSYGIVQKHGGVLSVESREGEGSTFTVTLPFAEEQPGDEASVAPELSGKLRILVIDDQSEIVNMLKAGLDKSGHTVFPATSGKEGLEIFQESPVDVVICDLGMPEMNGLQVGKSIKDVCEKRGVPKTPFVILTGWRTQVSEQENMDAAVVDAILEKPVEITKILEVITDLVRS